MTEPENTAAPYTKLVAWLKSLRANSAQKETARVEKEAETNNFTPEQKEMLKNIVELKDTRLDDLMIPRADIVALPQSSTILEVLEEFETSSRSRIILYDENLDDPLGYIHIKDVLSAMLTSAKANQPRESNQLKLDSIDLNSSLQDLKITRSLLYVPPSMPAVDLLEKMQATKVHLALVIDEYGGTDGLVSLADIVENIIGDIDDEQDEVEELISETGKDIFTADARISLEELAEHLGSDFKPSEEISDEVNTLGGYLTQFKGSLPVRGEVVKDGLFEFQVIDADNRRLKRLRITKVKPKPLKGTTP